MEQNQNSRGKTVSTLLREHRCLKTGKIISIYNNCDECDYYVYYPEVIEQQAERISELLATTPTVFPFNLINPVTISVA